MSGACESVPVNYMKLWQKIGTHDLYSYSDLINAAESWNKVLV